MTRNEIVVYNYGRSLAHHGVPIPEGFPVVLPGDDQPTPEQIANARLALHEGRFADWLMRGYRDAQTQPGV